MDENGMSMEQILTLIGAVLYALTVVGAAVPNTTKYKWLQPVLSMMNVIAMNLGYNRNAEDE